MAPKFEIMDKGGIYNYLRVKIKKLDTRGFKLSQPLLIEQVLRTLRFNGCTKPKDTPAVSSRILHKDLNGRHLETKWDYRKVLGQLNFLEKSTRPDLA